MNRSLIVLLLASGLSAGALQAAEAVDFNRDVRPILADKCYHCHGPDEPNRKGDLRLDTPEGAAAVIPAGEKIEETAFYHRITTSDVDEKMPPAESNFTKQLSATETATLVAWLKSGAKYQKHWAFEAPQQAPLPESPNPAWQRPIDRFVLERLAAEGLQPGPRADRITLLRRVTLDLTGLAPTAAEVDAFLSDSTPEAYERVVDRLLASPRFGERMTLAWMDLARYGDSSVYHADGPRDMWGWRDWVIEAYNQNMPFDQFTVEQLAGDLLPEATVSQKVASGFNRNHATTDEGGVIPEEFRVDYVVDRVKTVSSTWLAVSMECAQCHDHKYDPITQREYYQFYAYFNNTKDGGMQTRQGNATPLVEIKDPQAEAKQKIAAEARTQAETKLAEHKAKQAAAKGYREWLAKLPAIEEAPVVAVEPVLYLPCDEDDKQTHLTTHDGTVAILADGKIAAAKRPGGDGIKMSGNTAPEIAAPIDLEWNRPFTFTSWVKIPKDGGGALFAQMNIKAGHRGFDIGCEGQRPGLHLIHKWPENALKVYAKQQLKPDVWQHLVITGDGSGKAAGIAIYVDGVKQEPVVTHDTLAATIQDAKTPIRLGSRSEGARFKGEVDDLCVYPAALPESDVALTATGPIAAILSTPADIRTASQQSLLFDHYLRTQDKSYANLVRDLAKRLDDERKLAKGLSSVMIMEDLPAAQMRTTYILNRGQYDQPLKDQAVQAAVPAVFPPLPEGAPGNRLGLAKWLVQPDHPLTARVAVNRLWLLFFGEGLVRSTDDFGLQGEMPSHSELLDWLAVDFVQHKWDVKRMIKEIVLSETYCQDSRIRPELRDRDPDNRLYARGPRFRLQGEFIRDNFLAVSGLLNGDIGGPSVRPYQPPRIWEEVALDTNLSKYEQDHGEKLYRRSMYIFWKRSSPYPSLMIFDAPTREKCVGRRPRTNTPLQALVTLNDPQFVEAARVFAERILKTGGDTTAARIDFAMREALSRPATEKEQTLLAKLLAQQTERFAADAKKAEALVKIGEHLRDASLPIVEHAAWTVIASTVLNLDEFLMKN